MATIMAEEHWQTLLSRIRAGRCTPLLGAGVGSFAPAQIARTWAAQYGYPLQDRDNLAHVSKYIAITSSNSMTPKKMLSNLVKKLPRDAELPQTNLQRVLAHLPLPIYLTTNYDTILEQVLKEKGRHPISEAYQWSSRQPRQKSALDGGYDPTVARPLVFHLYGHANVPGSLVLTEDDHLEFLVGASCRSPLPPIVQEALAAGSLLFLGYSLSDDDLPTLFQMLSAFLPQNLEPWHWFVQPPPREASRSKLQKVMTRQYWEQDLSQHGVQVCWTSWTAFAEELEERWNLFHE